MVSFKIIDYKRVKGDLKKANADVAKLKKKASKKIGKQEYTDQFRESMRVIKDYHVIKFTCLMRNSKVN